ncbi:MAG: C25 family cysteine peptidase [Candidatus Thermoplasmatota archaeon]
MINTKKVYLVVLILLLSVFYSPTILSNKLKTSEDNADIPSDSLGGELSNRKNKPDIVVVSDFNPYFGIIGSYVSCFYSHNDSILKPLLLSKKGLLREKDLEFINKLESNHKVFSIGGPIYNYPAYNSINGSPSNVSLEVATYIFKNSSSVLILPYDFDKYNLCLQVAPLASYLNIPILIYEENSKKIEKVCKKLNASQAYIVGDQSFHLEDVNNIYLKNQDEIQNIVLGTISKLFKELNYVCVTNSADVKSSRIINSTNHKYSFEIKNFQIKLSKLYFKLYGKNWKDLKISIPQGINRFTIKVNLNKSRGFIDDLDYVNPLISLNLFDPDGELIGYSNNYAHKKDTALLETVCCNNPGDYNLNLSFFNGIKGGYFFPKSFSFLDAEVNVEVNISYLENIVSPDVKNLSMISSYLVSAHGGILLADDNFGLTGPDYIENSSGISSGPWYNESLHSFTNKKVNFTVDKIRYCLSLMEEKDLLKTYLGGPAWLALLGDTKMIPMYYYKPSQPGLNEKGLPSDNPYSLNFNLSVGRVLSYDVYDVFLLTARTFFYEKICKDHGFYKEWGKKFNFVFGEGFGETGGIFHQIPYSFKIRKFGFEPKVFGDLRNCRLYAERNDVFTGANYIEYLGHGDWFWFTPSLYGFDMLGKSFDVAHLKNWNFNLPSIFLSSACLMGRTDGILPSMSIGLTLLHAGCNCFIGSTRETGRESGLSELENNLIIKDWSVGEALRNEKKIDKLPPTFYVRTLYGDPAFNPYEPNNGFSNQGRPFVK